VRLLANPWAALLSAHLGHQLQNFGKLFSSFFMVGHNLPEKRRATNFLARSSVLEVTYLSIIPDAMPG
jgi:hypothetical protein